MAPILITGFIFVATLLLADTIIRWLFRRRAASSEIKNRLQALKARTDQTTAYNEFLSRRGISKAGPSVFSLRWFNRIYVQSGLDIKMSRRVLFLILFSLGGWIVGTRLFPGFVVGQVIFAVIFAFGLAFLVVFMKRRKRMRTFQRQLAPAIEIMVRSLNAGHPTSSSISLVSKEMADPIGSEFGLLSDQLTFGAPVETAFGNMIERVGVEELKLLAITVTVQRGTGGNLAEILQNLAKMIRDRLMLKAKIKAISAEGRFTAVIMAIFPFVLYFIIVSLVPNYFDDVIETGYAGTIVAVCLVLMGLGIIVLYRLVNFDF